MKTSSNAASGTASLIAILAILCVLFAMNAPQAQAVVDLVTPNIDATTNAFNMSFEYYPSLQNVQSCTLSVDGETFLDTTITNNAFNTFTVVNIAPGAHTWRVSCENGVTTELSVIRNFVIDRSPPVIAITSPAPSATIPAFALTYVATDDRSAALRCSVSANGTYLGVTTVASGVPTSLNASLPDALYFVTVACYDNASNSGLAQATVTVRAPPPTLFLAIGSGKEHYSLGEPVLITVDTLPHANVSVEICPNSTGFVQCFTPIIAGSFPQAIILPDANRTGGYLVDGVAIYGNQTRTARVQYTVDNTLYLQAAISRTPRIGEEVTLSARATGAIGAVTYRWTLSNGSNMTGSTLTKRYDTIGTFVERVVATDAAMNNVSANLTVTVQPLFAVTVTVVDALTGAALDNATVQLTREDVSDTRPVIVTGADGKAVFEREPDTYSLFVSRPGFAYKYDKLKVLEATALTVSLERKDNDKPVITLTSPADGATLTLPVEVSFTVQDASPVTCALSYAKSGEQWLQQSGTQTISDAQEYAFTLTSLEEAVYSFSIECVDPSDNRATSASQSFIVTQGTPQEPSLGDGQTLQASDDAIAAIDRAYGAYDSFTPEQKVLAQLLGWEEMIKERKRAIERADRDLNALQYRRDLSDQDKERERATLEKVAMDAANGMPLDLAIIDTRNRASYVTAERLAELVPAIRTQKGFAFTDEQLQKYLLKVQQDFTMETKLVRAKIRAADGSEVPISAVIHTFRYRAGASGTGASGTTGGAASGTGTSVSASVATVPLSAGGSSGDYTLYESLPEDVTRDAADVFTKSEHTVLSARPVAFEFAPEQQVVYFLKKDVPLDTLGAAQTVLLRKPTAADMKGITGNALFSFVPVLDWKLSLLLSAALLLAVFLLRAGLWHRAKYFLYAGSAKKELHGFRTLINDGLVHLGASDLDHAMMRYKEAKLTYERLSPYAKNEAYGDLEHFCSALDSAYFSLLADRIKAALDRGSLTDAIDDFQRLEATYERLSPEEQETLLLLVYELGRRLGVNDEDVSAASSGASMSGSLSGFGRPASGGGA